MGESCPHSQWQEFTLAKLTEGSEHEVYLEEAAGAVYKLTRPGTFGDWYYLQNGRVHQHKCMLAQYLVRLYVWEELFGGAPRPIGIARTGQIISRQKFIKGEIPAQAQVDEYLETSGLMAAKKSCFLWRRPYEQFQIWVGDTRDENFVLTEAGMAPIDLRVWVTNAEPT